MKMKMKMVKNLSRVGNSLALILTMPLRKLLKIDENTSFKITTDGDGLWVRPIRRKRKKKR